MSDRKNDEKNLNNDLDELRRLLDGAQGDQFTLDDILAEYAPKPPIHLVEMDPSGQEEQPPAAPIQFNLFETDGEVGLPPADAEEESLPENTAEETPTENAEEAPPEDTEETVPPEPDDSALPTVDEIEADLVAEETAQTIPAPPAKNNLIVLPKRRRSPKELWRSLRRQGDRYADGMFSEEGALDDPELLRREELIPGVDEELPPSRERRVRPKEEPEPDVSPQLLAERLGKGLRGMHTRLTVLTLLTLAALYLLAEPLLPLPDSVLLPLTFAHKIWISAGLLAAGILLTIDVLADTVRRVRRRRIDMDAVLYLACLFTLADALTMQFILPRQELPYCALNLLALSFALRGRYHRRRGVRLACRAAAASSEPYLVTLDERKWNGKDTYTKHTGPLDGFGSRIQADDGAQRVFRVFGPILLIACLVLTAGVCIAHRAPERLLWALSASLTAACALVCPLIFSRPFHRLSRRLIRSGGALAGWPGAADARRGAGIILTDLDLFPPGAVSLNGIKVFGQYSAERVIAYTATLIRASGCGLTKLFHDLLRSQGAIYREAERLCCYEGGGLSADIRGDQVLVGSAAFMNLMDVALPQGLNVKNAVFCAIDGELAGIFALNYSLPDAVFPAVDALLWEKISPVLATRDFNVIPAMLRQRFRLAADRMDFPPVERRRELSDPEQKHSDALTAVLCREGLAPFSDSVVGARRLRTAVRTNTTLACIAGVIGLLLAAYLTSKGAFASISPVNLLAYLLLWLLPGWLVMGWVDRF